MAKESKAIGHKPQGSGLASLSQSQKAMVCLPIGKATGIKSWPEDGTPSREAI